MLQLLRSRPAGVLLTAAIVCLTLATANIHRSLGGPLFTLNALGYVAFAVAIVVGAAVTIPFVARFSWAPRVGLMGYAATTIAAYLIMGPYFTLGWIAKGIEVALIVLVAVDILRVHGSPAGLFRSAVASVASILPTRSRPSAV